MHKQILPAAHKISTAVHGMFSQQCADGQSAACTGQTVNPDACESRRGQKRHDVGHATGRIQRPARLSQPRRGRLPAAAPGHPACRKTRPSPRFDGVSSSWPQQQGTRAPPAGPRASRRPPHSAAATSAPRQSRSGGVTKHGDAGQLPCGSTTGLRRRPLRRALQALEPVIASPQRDGHMVAGGHPALRIAWRRRSAASSSGANTTPDKG